MEKQRLHLFLNRLLANYFVIHMKWYRYQWFAKGSHAILLQSIFKQFQTIWQRDLEEIAEHIIYLNGKPFATMVKFIKEASLEEAQADDLESEMFEQLISDLRLIIYEIEEEGIAFALEANDLFTVHFLLQLQKNISKIISRCQHITFES